MLVHLGVGGGQLHTNFLNRHTPGDVHNTHSHYVGYVERIFVPLVSSGVQYVDVFV